MNVEAAKARDLHALYHEAILSRSRSPERFGRLTNATHRARGLNPLCGDKIEIELQISNDHIHAFRFQAVGCALCVATGSILGQCTDEKSVELSRALANQTMNALVNQSAAFPEGALSELSHVREFPSRIKCVSLALQAFLAALDGTSYTVSSE